ncbi:MAG TPA: glycoside hydrolase family 15 protein, partial [Ktedonobacterales bacterium]|nr:glycoside hydrolase family 15 protein [Ktedonobacterales bacterium]
NYDLRDIYWPHVGQFNQTEGHVNHTGVWADGAFSWFEGDGWQRDLRYENDSLTTDVTMRHDGMQLTLACTDAVDFNRNLLVRRMRVTNTADHPRDVRVFFHHDWHIGESEGGDTVYYRPDLKVLVAYKDRCTILIGGLMGDDLVGAPAATRQAEEGITRWATGYKEVDGKQGTWKDAEDGELGGNPIAQGSVDSTVGFDLGELPPGGSRTLYTWLIIAESYRETRDLHRRVLAQGPDLFIARTRNFWHLWVTDKPMELGDLSDAVTNQYKRSLLIMRTQSDDNGAIIAATDADVWLFNRDSYAYMWPRDGALVANALSHAGYSDITSAFFHFCAGVMADEGYLLHKYTPAGALGSSWQPWVDDQGKLVLPIQEDETALVVYALWQHFTLFHEVEFVRPLYRPLVIAAGRFMAGFREPHTGLPAPSWDLWEERRGVHAYTVAATYAGLTAAAHFATAFGETDDAARFTAAAEEIKAAARKYLWSDQVGRFVRMVTVQPDGTVVPDLTIDASLAGLYQFGMFEVTSDEIRATMDAVAGRLTVKSEVGGVARYENDLYHQVSHDLANVPGNPWFICTCWLAEYQIAKAQTLDELRAAVPWLAWVAAHALPSGVLAEQIDPYSHAPLSVSPLTWSHAEFVSAVRWYAGKYHRLAGSPVAPASTPLKP